MQVQIQNYDEVMNEETSSEKVLVSWILNWSSDFVFPIGNTKKTFWLP